MSKLEIVQQLPPASTAQQMLLSIQKLEQTLAHYDRTLATAINRMLDQGDAMAAELEPLLALRQQLVETLTKMMMHSKASCDAARNAAQVADQAASGLREVALSLRQGCVKHRPTWWKYGAVSGLCAALLLGCIKLLPSLAIQPRVTMDPVTTAQQIAAELRLQCQQRSQTTVGAGP